MDTITQGIVAITLAKGIAEERYGRVAVGAFVVGAVFPDLDVLFHLFSQGFLLAGYRGITHSLVLLPFWAMLLTWLVCRVAKHPFTKEIFLAVSGGLLSHIILDATTTWGEMIFYPLSRWRVSWDHLFAVDPYYSAGLLVFLFFLLKTKNLRWARVGLAFLISYHFFAAANYWGARQLFVREMQNDHLPTEKITVLPIAGKPFKWVGVSETPTQYITKEVDVFWGNSKLSRVFEHNKNKLWTKPAKETPLGSLISHGARLPAYERHEVDEWGSRILIKDLQFEIRPVLGFTDTHLYWVEQMFEGSRLLSERYRVQ